MRVTFKPHVDARDSLTPGVETECHWLVNLMIERPTLVQPLLDWLTMSVGATGRGSKPPSPIALPPPAKRIQAEARAHADALWENCRRGEQLPDLSAAAIWDRARGRMLEYLTYQLVKATCPPTEQVVGQSSVWVNRTKVFAGSRDSIDVGARTAPPAVTQIAAFECKISSRSFLDTPDQWDYLVALTEALRQEAGRGDRYTVAAVTADARVSAKDAFRTRRPAFQLVAAEDLIEWAATAR